MSLETLPVGLTVYAERTLVEMTKVAFSVVDKYTYDEDPEVSGIVVRAGSSFEENERLPQIAVTVGDLASYRAAIDDRLTWSDTEEERLYTDQFVAVFSVFAELEAEANDLADFLKSRVRAAKNDLAARGIFGIQNVSVGKAIPAEPGTREDYRYKASLHCGFMMVSKTTLGEDDSDPLWEAIGSLGHRVDRSGTVHSSVSGENEFGNESDATASATTFLGGETLSARRVKIMFSSRITPSQVSRLVLKADGIEVFAPAVRDKWDLTRVNLEVERDLKSHEALTIEYDAQGNLRDDLNRAISAFGPVAVDNTL